MEGSRKVGDSTMTMEWHDPVTEASSILKQFVDDLVKYQTDGVKDNGVPMFMDHAGGVPVQAAAGYYTNQTLPYFETNAPAKTTVSEVYSMPAAFRTGHDVDGSSLHMQINDGGTKKSGYVDTTEQTMASLKLIKEAAEGDDERSQIIADIEKMLKQINSHQK